MLDFSISGTAMQLPEYLEGAAVNYELVRWINRSDVYNYGTSESLPHIIGPDVIYGPVYF